jgi:hypothetical protein
MPTVRRTRPWTSKPPIAAQINWGHPFVANGLQLFYGARECSGSILFGDANPLPLTNTGATWTNSGAMNGLNFSAANSFCTGLLAAPFKFVWPVSLAMGFRYIGAPNSTDVRQFGSTFDATEGAPYIPWGFYWTTNGIPTISYANGSTFTQTSIQGGALSANTDYVVSATITSAAQSSWINGVPAGSSANSISNPTYSAAAQMCIGSNVVGTTANIVFYWGAIWNVALAAANHAAIGSSPNAIWQIFQPAQGAWLFPSVGGSSVIGTGTISLSGFSISGAGSFTDLGSGAITLGPLSPSGIGTFSSLGAGSITLGPLGISSTGAFSTSGSGAIALGPLSPSGVGTFGVTGSGAITLSPVGISGTGFAGLVGSGNVNLGAFLVSGVGSFTDVGSGAISLSSVIVAGAGFFPGTGSQLGTADADAARLISVLMADPAAFMADPDAAREIPL